MKNRTSSSKSRILWWSTSRTARLSTPSTVFPSIWITAKRWVWWARPVQARPPLPNPSSGILPDVGCKVTGGEIHLDGQELLTLHENEMRKIRGNKISMIFQDPMTALNPVQKVGDQIAEVVRLHNDNHVNPEERAKEMLETVGIPAERYSEYPISSPAA